MSWLEALALLAEAKKAVEDGIDLARDVQAKIGDALYVVSVEALMWLAKVEGSSKAVRAMSAALVGIGAGPEAQEALADLRAVAGGKD